MFFLVVAGASSCGGSDAPYAAGTIDGFVYVTGPVIGAKVSAYSLDRKTGETTLVASSEATDEAGHFHLDLASFTGPLMLIARGPAATYKEPATGVSVAWDTATELRAVYVERADGLVLDFPLSKAATDVVVSPWSELAVTHGLAVAAADKTAVGEALVKSYGLFATLLDLDFWAVVPTDLTQHGGGWNESIQSGAELGGLSKLVASMAEKSDSSTSGITTLRLLSLWQRDLKDLRFDGKASSTDAAGGIKIGTCPNLCELSACTASAFFAESIGEFLNSPQNQSGINVADALGIRAHIGKPLETGAAPLFPDQFTCKLDTQPPTVSLLEVRSNGDEVELQDATILTGTRKLKVHAVDSSDIGSISVTFYREDQAFDPPGFKDIVETPDGIQILDDEITLHTTVASDGAYEVRVVAKDAAGNESDLVKKTIIIDNTDAGNISGTVTVGGRVDNARVRVYRYDNGVVGDTPLVEGHTTNEGIFTLTLPDNTAQTLLVLADGDPLGTTKYTEASSGATVTFSAQDSLELILSDWSNGQSRIAQVTPWTDIGASLARAVWQTKGSVPALWSSSVASAYAMLEQHFADGGPSIVLRDVVPDDLTQVGSSTITDNVRYGLMVAALGRIADKHALQSGASSASMNTLTLTKKLAQDAEVCALNAGTRECLDGRDSGQIVHGIVALTSYVTRDQLAIAAVDFLASARNHSGFHDADFDALFEVLGADTGDRGQDLPHLYPAGDEPQFYDQIDPTAVFQTPSPTEGAVLRGSVSLKVVATDNRALASLEFTGNAAVLPRISNSAIDTTNGTGSTVRRGPWVRTGTLNAEALADGDYAVEATATDEAHRPKVSTLHLTVDKTNPTAVISGATAGGVPLANGAVTGASTATITGTVTDAHLLSARYVLNGAAPVAITLGAGGAFSVNVNLAADTNTFTVTGVDRAGNTGSASSTYIRDASPPTVALVTASITQDESVVVPASGPVTYNNGSTLKPIINGVQFKKYASNYGPASSNLPVWQFTVTDNRSTKPNITLKGRLSRGDAGLLTDWFVINPSTLAGVDRALVVSSAVHPDIASEEDTFTLEYQAFDQFGNAAAIASVHWTQTLKAPPLRQTTFPTDPCSENTNPPPAPNLASCANRYFLGGDHATGPNNANVLIQGGTSLPNGRVYIAYGQVENPNQVPVRVQFDVSATGIAGYWYKTAMVESSSNVSGAPDSCSTEDFVNDHNLDGSCITPGPPVPAEDRRLSVAVNNLFTDLQVVTATGEVLDPCVFCGANEREIPPNTRVTVLLRSTPWSFLWPLMGALGPIAAVDANGGGTGVQGPQIKHCSQVNHPHGDVGEVCARWSIARGTKFLVAAKLTPQAKVSLQAKPASFVGTYVPAEGIGTTNFSYSPHAWCRQRNPVNADPTTGFPCN